MSTKKHVRIGVIFLLVAAMMAVGLVSAQAAFEGDFEFEIRDGGAVVTGYRGPGGDVVVPDTLGRHPVTRIDNSAFRNIRSLVSIVIPEGVTTIGAFAFQGSFALTGVVLPETLTAFGTNVFKDCTGLREIVIPSRVTVISERMFYDCVGLNVVILPDSITVIEKEAFYNNRGLTNITIPSSVQDIERNSFRNARNVTFVVARGSYAERVAQSRNIPFTHIEDIYEILGN
ncbi:MAG: leucine-rich repeat domain-containing protein [Clostridia bacterium]|nr:leucine-rich repeat domain-containing protein [Clostridia bacterium]